MGSSNPVVLSSKWLETGCLPFIKKFRKFRSENFPFGKNGTYRLPFA